MEYYLFDFERMMWWKPNKRGYTNRIEEAGVYSQAMAELTTVDANATQGTKQIPNTAMVPCLDYYKPINMAGMV